MTTPHFTQDLRRLLADEQIANALRDDRVIDGIRRIRFLTDLSLTAGREVWHMLKRVRESNAPEVADIPSGGIPTAIPAPLAELQAAQERIAQLEAALKPLSKMYHDLIAEGYDVENNNHRLIVVIVLNAGAKEEYTGCDLHSEEFRNAAKALKVEKAS